MPSNSFLAVRRIMTDFTCDFVQRLAPRSSFRLGVFNIDMYLFSISTSASCFAGGVIQDAGTHATLTAPNTPIDAWRRWG
ncbi:hypothetical protein OH492_13410 [Vibrio chagasii]|nr:hypothetical protein [Vibrio chagasii]